MKHLLYISIFLFVCFECESQTLYTCTDCNCFLRSPCADNPTAFSLCLTNTSQINCRDFGFIQPCIHGCGINSDGNERCLCQNNCTGHGYCSLGVDCICDEGYFGAYCDQTDFCFGKPGGLHCDTKNSSQMIGCYEQRVDSYHTCHNCTYEPESLLGFCNCPNNCSGNGTCSQDTRSLGECKCNGNLVGPSCSTEFTTCPPSLTKKKCSGNTLVSCENGNVGSFKNCDYQCVDPATSQDSYCTCENNCNGKGSCNADGVCSCFQGYVGKGCNETTACTLVADSLYVCINETTIGYCSAYELSSYTQNCPFGCYSGACICDATNCIYGTCLSSGACSCNTGWSGPRCNENIGISPLPVVDRFCASKVQGNYCDGDNLVNCYLGTILTTSVCQFGCNSTLWAGSHSCRTINCPPGYFGRACENADPCLQNSFISQDFCVGNYAVSCNLANTTSRTFCVNGCATSTVNGRSIASCNCNCGPQGRDCDVYGNCACQTGWLSCASGFAGDKCEISTNVCAGKSSATVCQASNSTLLHCFNGIVAAEEKCQRGCNGDKGCACENNCSGNGFCGPNGECFCKTGFAGNDCSQTLECTGQSNGFLCDSLGQNLLTCMRNRVLFNATCPGGCVDGKCKCQFDCNGQGTCRNGVCSCKNGFAGDTCEIYLDSDIASVFIIVIAVGLGASIAYAVIIYVKTRVTTPEIELEDLRVKNRPNNGRLKISQRATTVIKLNYNGAN